jgi:hypothetical protein
MLIAGISVSLEVVREVVAGIKAAGMGLALAELPTSTVTAAGGRIDEPTTSARNRFRVPCAVAREVSM